MFWDSIIGGLKLFSIWQIWLASIIYALVMFLFFLTVSLIIGNKEDSGRGMIGCFTFSIGGIILEGILMSLIVIFLFPIFLGQQSITPLSEVVNFLRPIVEAGLIATIIVTILTVLPIIGNIIASLPGVQSFLMGLIIFTIFTRNQFEALLLELNIQGSIYPNIWQFIGYIILASLLTWLLILIFSIIFLPFGETALGSTMMMFIGQVVGVIAGIITLCMYAKFILIKFLENV